MAELGVAQALIEGLVVLGYGGVQCNRRDFRVLIPNPVLGITHEPRPDSFSEVSRIDIHIEDLRRYGLRVPDRTEAEALGPVQHHKRIQRPDQLCELFRAEGVGTGPDCASIELAAEDLKKGIAPQGMTERPVRGCKGSDRESLLGPK